MAQNIYFVGRKISQILLSIYHKSQPGGQLFTTRTHSSVVTASLGIDRDGSCKILPCSYPTNLRRRREYYLHLLGY